MEKKKRLLQICVPTLIVLMIVAVYVLKTSQASEKPVPEGSLPFEVETLDMAELTAHGLPILINFRTEYCPACKQMAPDLQEVYTALDGKAVILSVNADKAPELAANYPLPVVPTQFFYNADGTPYVPGESSDIQFTSYSNRETGEHALTAHQGVLTKAQMLAILEDMGVQQ